MGHALNHAQLQQHCQPWRWRLLFDHRQVFLSPLTCPAALMLLPRGAPGAAVRGPRSFPRALPLWDAQLMLLTRRWHPTMTYQSNRQCTQSPFAWRFLPAFFPPLSCHSATMKFTFLMSYFFILLHSYLCSPRFLIFFPCSQTLSWFIEESILFSVQRCSNQSATVVLYLGLLEGSACSPPGQLNVFKCIFR